MKVDTFLGTKLPVLALWILRLTGIKGRKEQPTHNLKIGVKLKRGGDR
jgi:hypothetical protein